jgi:DNA polymerase
MTIDELRDQAAECTRCDLYRNATATVFGEGAEHARLVVVGEQPGDQEDRQGRPFVGPAGALLDRAFVDAGIDRGSLYVTNAVKHFKWTPRGKRRLHQTPNRTEVVACSAWLTAELQTVTPELVVALGATAGKALLGPTFRVTKQRGQVVPATIGDWDGSVVGTIHPSAILRLEDPDEREDAYGGFVDDLRTAAAWSA